MMMSSRTKTARLAVLVGALLLAAPAAHALCFFPPPDGCAEAFDNFGRRVVRGDFNGDGFQDLAVGLPLEDIGSIFDAGAVEVIYGTRSGLGPANRQLWSQNSADVEDLAEANDIFGFSLAAGDFNGDGFDDLAIGVPGEDVGSLGETGAVNVLHGSPTGLSATFVLDQFWSQDSAFVEDVAEAGDILGLVLAAGDFNGDGRDDLAIVALNEDIGSIGDAGAVNVLFGSPTGLSATFVPDQFWSQASAAVDDTAEAGDIFGISLAAGDFNGDGRDDLAVGVLGETSAASSRPGRVNVLHGSPTGLNATVVPDQFWSQDSAGVENAAEANDNFGFSLAAGDFNGDGRADLAIGVPFEDVNDASGVIEDAGAVSVVYGASGGLSATAVPDQVWTQLFISPPLP